MIKRPNQECLQPERAEHSWQKPRIQRTSASPLNSQTLSSKRNFNSWQEGKNSNDLINKRLERLERLEKSLETTLSRLQLRHAWACRTNIASTWAADMVYHPCCCPGLPLLVDKDIKMIKVLERIKLWWKKSGDLKLFSGQWRGDLRRTLIQFDHDVLWHTMTLCKQEASNVSSGHPNSP